MAVYRPDIPPHVAEIVRHLPSDIKRSIKQALRSLSANPFSGTPLIRKLSGLWSFKVRRFRIIYELDRKARLIRIFAIGHRREVYEELADRMRRAAVKKWIGRSGTSWTRLLLPGDSSGFAQLSKRDKINHVKILDRYEPSRGDYLPRGSRNQRWRRDNRQSLQ